MKLSLALLAASALALGGGIAVNATAPMTPRVNDAVVSGDAMPRTLSEYGFFADASATRPAANVIPYRLNTPLFSDGAEKLRYLYLPEASQAKSMGPDLLDLPVGAALIKTFAFGEGEDRRFIETRVLLHRADGWVALPYLWNAEQTEAKLAVAGARVPVTTPDGQEISYRVPNKNQCKECHGLNDAVVPIGPKGRNLSAEWLTAMVESGHLDRMDDGMDLLPLWESRDTMPAELMARAYLDVNCAHCHRPQATASNSGLDLRWEQRDPFARGVNKRPVAAGRGAGGHLFDIVPGKPDASILVYRMESSEPGVAMPELGKSTVDEAGVKVVRDWIAGMPAR